jgi:beta-phosphoglucomutase-like phosphatase (HAD superfamily)
VEALLPHGIEVDEAFRRENVSGRVKGEIVGDLLPNLSAQKGREIVEAREAGFRERAGDLQPLPGLMEPPESAKGRDSRTGLVTNAPRENVAAVLAALGPEDFATPSPRQRRSVPPNRNRTRKPT